MKRVPAISAAIGHSTKGSITIVHNELPRDPEPPLVKTALEDAAGYP